MFKREHCHSHPPPLCRPLQKEDRGKFTPWSGCGRLLASNERSTRGPAGLKSHDTWRKRKMQAWSTVSITTTCHYGEVSAYTTTLTYARLTAKPSPSKLSNLSVSWFPLLCHGIRIECWLNEPIPLQWLELQRLAHTITLIEVSVIVSIRCQALCGGLLYKIYLI